MTLHQMYVGLKNIVLSQHLKQKRCSFEDTQFFSQLLSSGYSFSQCMDYLETKDNHECFASAREKMKQGIQMQEWIDAFFDASVSSRVKSFLTVLSLSDALSLSLTLFEQMNASKKQFQKMTLYPVIMFLFSLFGVQLFCFLCMPSLISMMKGFDVSVGMIELIYHGMMMFSMILIVFISVCTVVLIWFLQKKRIVMLVVILYQLRLGFLIEKELSLHFALLYFQCIQLGIPTKTALEMLKECKDQPLTVFLAWHIDQVLQKGGNLSQAMSIRYLDPSLQRLMKTAMLSGGAKDLLKGYLQIAVQKREKRLQRFGTLIQSVSYGFIAVMILLVYQVLFLPLSMLERM